MPGRIRRLVMQRRGVMDRGPDRNRTRFDNSVVIDGVFGLTTSVSSAQAEETGPVLLPSPE